MAHLGTFRPEFEETIVIFEISTFKFGKLQSFILQREKNGTKNALFRSFRTGISKNHGHI